MIIELKKKEHGIHILSLFPVSEVEEEEYPVGMFFEHSGRKYMAYSYDKNLEDAALESLKNDSRVRFENLYDVTKLVVSTILTTGHDFYGEQSYREAFEQDAGILWPKVVCDLLHDIVRYRLDEFFHYGDGHDGLHVHMDILTRISFPLKGASEPR